MMKQLAPAVFSIALVAGSGVALAAENSPIVNTMREAQARQMSPAQQQTERRDRQVVNAGTDGAAAATVTRRPNVDID